MFTLHADWEIREIELNEICFGPGVSVFQELAADRPQILLYRFEDIPWVLVLQIAPRGEAICNGIGSSVGITRPISDFLSNWGRDKAAIKSDYNYFVKEIARAGFKRKHFPIHLASNYANFGEYLGKESLCFGMGDYAFDGYSCNGVIVPREWEKSLVDYYVQYLRDFPDRSFVRLNDNYWHIDPPLGRLPLNYFIGKIAISMTNPASVGGWGEKYGVRVSKLLSDDGLISSINEWLDSSILLAKNKRTCDLELAYQHLNKATPILYKDSFSLAKGRDFPQFSASWEPDIYLKRAKLIEVIDSPHQYDDIKENYSRLKNFGSEDITRICSILEGYLERMEEKAPYLANPPIPFAIQWY